MKCLHRIWDAERQIEHLEKLYNVLKKKNDLSKKIGNRLAQFQNTDSDNDDNRK